MERVFAEFQVFVPTRAGIQIDNIQSGVDTGGDVGALICAKENF